MFFNYKISKFADSVMRDIIWTLIILWLIYKVVAIFKGNSANKQKTTIDSNQEFNTKTPSDESDGKSAMKKHLNNEGEYVDYEEIK